MNVIRSNIFGYHIIALVIGAVYFYGSIYGFNLLGAALNPIFENFQPDPESVATPVAINIVVAFTGSLVPALLFVTIMHFTLNPNSKLFLFTSSFSFVMLSVWNVIESYYSENVYVDDLSYLYALSGKALGGLVALLLVCIVYLRVKPNKAL